MRPAVTHHSKVAERSGARVQCLLEQLVQLDDVEGRVEQNENHRHHPEDREVARVGAWKL